MASFADREKFLLSELEKYKEMRNDHFKRRNEAEKFRQESVNVSNVKNRIFTLKETRALFLRLLTVMLENTG